jgi:hypothetical protein
VRVQDQLSNASTTTSARNQRNALRAFETAKDNVQRLDKALGRMEASPLSYRIGEGELKRRRGMMARLQQQITAISDILQHGPTMASAARGKKSVRIEETEQTRAMANQELLLEQRAKVAEQDEKLDGVLSGLQKIKQQSYDIHAELDLHAGLLDDLNQTVDSTDARVVNNTRVIEDVSEREGSGWCFMCTMLILLILIVLLASTNWACHIFNNDKC